MKKILPLLASRQLLAVLALVVVSLLIWVFGPFVSFGDIKPFTGIGARVLSIAVLLAGVLLWLLAKPLRLGRKEEESPAALRLREITAIAKTALSRLKSMRTGARGLGKLFQGKRYLYEVPWYLALGVNGSGKTSALLGGGLLFPLAEQMQRAAGALPDDARALDWWLTNEAVLIDTPGYYTSHVATGGGRGEAHRAEWMAFLRLLSRYRPRAPINGALLFVDLTTLLGADEHARTALAAALRARLTDLREALGIRFPVYVVVTKMDRLTGFTDYFSGMTAASHAQTWGFALPYGKQAVAKEGLRVRCQDELSQLARRLADTVDTRLQDECNVAMRRRLNALPEEFSGVVGPLIDLIDCVFLDSRYDITELHSSLRGVYFASALQRESEITAKRCTVTQRLAAAVKRLVAAPCRHEGRQSYFLRDLFKVVIFPDAHLVTPNLRWEYRSRLTRLVAHAFAVAVFAPLALGLYMSFGRNLTYVDAIGAKARQLTARVMQLYKEPKPQAVPDALADARELPAFPGLTMSVPEAAWRFGLYTPPDIVAESRRTYDALEDRLLLPQIVQRIEAVLTKAIADKDAKTAYDALRVYLMLYDKAKFHADDVEAWVLDDWAKNDSAAVFGGRASMIDHVRQLFSGKRVVQSPVLRNDALTQQARAFLDGSNATDRLYQRAKTAMMKEAPDEFTLLRAVGPQAGTVFTRASRAPISRGVPGLFTFDGYHNVFDKRLPEFVRVASNDDAWVMGRSYLGGTSGADDALTHAIRREYLVEYAEQWDAFLGDIRSVSGTSLAFNLQVLRSLAAPDSPLARLARAAVHETTLAAPIAGVGGSLLQKAADKLDPKTNKTLSIRASAPIERELVDNRFAALREVVTGSADAQTGDSPAIARARSIAQASNVGLDGVASLLNDYYTALTVSNNALSTNSLPPTSDAAVKLKLTADTMPAPFQAVLLQLAVDGSREVNEGIGQLLSRQMQSVVGDTCRLTIEGNYPFAPQSTRDVSLADFTRLFAQGGVIDDFFTKTLAPFVDTAAKPWRYRTLPGATEPVQGPDLEPFEHAQAIRDIFFDDPGHKQLRWQAQIRIPELDPTITTLSMDIDGQPILYQHGPVVPFAVTWPGPRGGAYADISASPRIAPNPSTLAADGPWALMRLLHKGHVIETATLGRTRVAFEFDGRKTALDIVSAASVANPLTSDVLSTFRCPTSMPMFNLSDSGPPPGLPSGGIPMPVNESKVSH
jgi:type VI secretion system protein ImpL